MTAPDVEIAPCTAEELMAVVAARAVRDGHVVLVEGDGPGAVAAQLARRTHAPRTTVLDRSGAVDVRLDDGALTERSVLDAALTVVAPAEIDGWVQAGRVDVGFVTAVQIDRHANLNATVLGEYDEPTERLPGGGATAEAAAWCGEVVVLLPHRLRSFVEQVDFVTAVGHGTGPHDRALLGLRGRGPVRVVTDLGVLEPDPETVELVLTALHPGVDVEQVRAETGWDLQVAPEVVTTPAPTAEELAVVRSLRPPAPGTAGDGVAGSAV
ncbi:CoA-transferase subunit beta [Pseudonocardia benzenivorans]|uniref:CoA-transferase subunit beta n=1 Tax=Pseudonocardia benzenivorans TaxID=228005 RepID=A0ABW3VGY9_9PSEU